MYKILSEGKAIFKAPTLEKISKEMPVFYNPVMKLNRDLAVLLLNSVNSSDMRIALPLAGTGVRGIRFLKELDKGKIKGIYFNDYSAKAANLIKGNLKLNKITKKFEVHNEDANLFLLKSAGFDYIDVDPFGSPNFLLNSAIIRLSRTGILAVTATDTSSLCGTYPAACKRKYWALPKRDELKHETGLRILIRKAQLVAAQFEKALTPIFSYAHEHYLRVFFSCEKGKKKVDKILKQHGMFNDAGPMWLGRLWDKKLASKMYQSERAKASEATVNNKINSRFLKNKKYFNGNENNGNNKKTNNELIKLLSTIKEESKINSIGFFDIHKLCKKHKIKQIPKKQDLINIIKKKGYKASETHFCWEGIRSNISKDKFISLLKL